MSVSCPWSVLSVSESWFVCLLFTTSLVCFSSKLWLSLVYSLSCLFQLQAAVYVSCLQPVLSVSAASCCVCLLFTDCLVCFSSKPLCLSLVYSLSCLFQQQAAVSVSCVQPILSVSAANFGCLLFTACLVCFSCKPLCLSLAYSLSCLFQLQAAVSVSCLQPILSVSTASRCVCLLCTACLVCFSSKLLSVSCVQPVLSVSAASRFDCRLFTACLVCFSSKLLCLSLVYSQSCLFQQQADLIVACLQPVLSVSAASRCVCLLCTACLVCFSSKPLCLFLVYSLAYLFQQQAAVSVSCLQTVLSVSAASRCVCLLFTACLVCFSSG